MKNLLERLKPEYLELLENYALTAPLTADLFKKSLSNDFSWLQITYANLILIESVFKIKIDITEINNLFDE